MNTQNKWTDLIVQHFRRDYFLNGFGLALGCPPTSVVLQAFRNNDFAWPAEFVDIYQCHNGFGYILKGDKIHWLFVPMDQLSDFHVTATSLLRETHPDIARAFHPFIDWQSGDYIGYLNNEGALRSQLYQFDHELYAFSADQPWQEFLLPSFASIRGYLE